MVCHRLGQLLADGGVYPLCRFRSPLTQLWIALDFYQRPGILLSGASSHGGYLSLNFDSPNSVKRLGFSRHVAECNPSCVLRIAGATLAH